MPHTPDLPDSDPLDELTSQPLGFRERKVSAVSILILIPLLIAALFGFVYQWDSTQILRDENAKLKETINLASKTAGTGAAAVADTSGVKDAGVVVPLRDIDHVRGSRNAKVLVIEYSDFECPFCKSFHATMQQLSQTYGDQIAWVYRHNPLSIHANAAAKAEASECVAAVAGNDAFWKFTDALFQMDGGNLDLYADAAVAAGADRTRFTQCYEAGTYRARVTDDTADGVEAGVDGTPSTIVMTSGNSSGKLIVGAQPLATVKAVIDALLK